MKTFLESVAEDLYHKIGNDLARTAIVFPNKRASLFFSEYLAKQCHTPLWSPAYVSISELFRDLSKWQIGDPIQLVCELYKVFCEETHSEETLDDFYFWGEILISDFDDADKNKVDTKRLFSNLQDLKNIMDDYEFLDEEQEEAIKEFFRNFSIEKRTVLKEKFISLWDKLGDIYLHYKKNLSDLGIAYEGMMYREVVENLQTDSLAYNRYVFVGFNVLNQVETAFFDKLQEAGKAMFYWDYDEFYTQGPADLSYRHEAGEFITRNLKRFPNELSADCFKHMKLPKKIRFISSPTENAQARYLSRWIDQDLKDQTDLVEKETAVVLCNESILLPVLHSMPQRIKHVNVTMGFPLAQTPVFSFINALLDLQTIGYKAKEGCYLSQYVLSVLKHPYTRQVSTASDSLQRDLIERNRFYPLPSELKRDTILERIFSPQESISSLCHYLIDRLKDISSIYRKEGDTKDTDLFNQLYRESLFKSYTLINRLYTLTETGELKNIRMDTFRRLLNRLLTAANIPFHGEPAIGMQVMGVLETRNLDFRNILLLSVNEGQLPKSEGDSSFIPYNLRKAFGMTTIEHKNSVYAYYFYRLLQRAENITIMFNNSTDGMNRGEMSRFMLQLLAELPQNIQQTYIEAGQAPVKESPIRVEKTPEIMAFLQEKYNAEKHPNRVLSPSALNTYMDCQLKFYYRYVEELAEPEDMNAEIDSALFGSIFHRSAELAYTALTAHQSTIYKEDLEKLLKNETEIQKFVDAAFKELFFKSQSDERPPYNGTELIHAKAVAFYLKQLLRIDSKYAPFEMVGMEKRVKEVFEIETTEGKLKVNIGGTIDRMDKKGDTLRIVDYKTGGQPKNPSSLEQLFVAAEDRPNYIFQAFLYAAIMCRQQPLKVAPALLYIHHAASEQYSSEILLGPSRQKMPVNNFAFYEDDFREMLKDLLEEMMNPAIAFQQTEVKKHCEYCEFQRLCKRI